MNYRELILHKKMALLTKERIEGKQRFMNLLQSSFMMCDKLTVCIQSFPIVMNGLGIFSVSTLMMWAKEEGFSVSHANESTFDVAL